MNTLIAIHDQPGSYSDRWLQTCRERDIPFKRVDCRDTSIIQQLSGVSGLLWNWNQDDADELLIARQVMTAAERMGIHTFPNTATNWHYEDKIAQKYLLEAVRAPLIPSYVFVDRQTAMQWIETADFPKVFKLRCGAGSSNVSLVKNREEARRLCRVMFSRGRPASPSGYFYDARSKVRHIRDVRHFLEKLKRMPVSLRKARRIQHLQPVQRGYLYFQDFLPNNTRDNRVTVIGGRAFAAQRLNRPGDFRASGSGDMLYDQSKIDPRCIRVTLDIAKRLETQSLSFDILFDTEDNPAIAEFSYTTNAEKAIYLCPGYWDENMGWHEGHYWPQDLILKDMLARITDKDRAKHMAGADKLTLTSRTRGTARKRMIDQV